MAYPFTHNGIVILLILLLLPGQPCMAGWSMRAQHSLFLCVCLATALEVQGGPGPERNQDVGVGRSTNSFPELNDVFQGRVFETTFDREVFFLRRIRQDYPQHWPELLDANIVVQDYVAAPDKLRRFIDELGVVTAGTDDPAACTNLARITSEPRFYANPDASRPDLLKAATAILIGLGPRGRHLLADAFSESHYRTDPESLVVLAESVSHSGSADPKLATALAATAFSYTATNGGFYPRCTQEVTRQLLKLTNGFTIVAEHLNTKEVLDDPGRLEAVVDGIGIAQAAILQPKLAELTGPLASKIEELVKSPGPYRDALVELQDHLKRTITQLNGNEHKQDVGR